MAGISILSRAMSELRFTLAKLDDGVRFGIAIRAVPGSGVQAAAALGYGPVFGAVAAVDLLDAQ